MHLSVLLQLALAVFCTAASLYGTGRILVNSDGSNIAVISQNGKQVQIQTNRVGPNGIPVIGVQVGGVGIPVQTVQIRDQIVSPDGTTESELISQIFDKVQGTVGPITWNSLIKEITQQVVAGNINPNVLVALQVVESGNGLMGTSLLGTQGQGIQNILTQQALRQALQGQSGLWLGQQGLLGDGSRNNVWNLLQQQNLWRAIQQGQLEDLVQGVDQDQQLNTIQSTIQQQGQNQLIQNVIGQQQQQQENLRSVGQKEVQSLTQSVKQKQQLASLQDAIQQQDQNQLIQNVASQQQLQQENLRNVGQRQLQSLAQAVSQVQQLNALQNQGLGVSDIGGEQQTQGILGSVDQAQLNVLSQAVNQQQQLNSLQAALQQQNQNQLIKDVASQQQVQQAISKAVAQGEVQDLVQTVNHGQQLNSIQQAIQQQNQNQLLQHVVNQQQLQQQTLDGIAQTPLQNLAQVVDQEQLLASLNGAVQQQVQNQLIEDIMNQQQTGIPGQIPVGLWQQIYGNIGGAQIGNGLPVSRQNVWQNTWLSTPTSYGTSWRNTLKGDISGRQIMSRGVAGYPMYGGVVPRHQGAWNSWQESLPQQGPVGLWSGDMWRSNPWISGRNSLAGLQRQGQIRGVPVQQIV